MFCMLARKHLIGSRLLGIEQLGCDRVLTFTFQCINEMGDEVQKSIVLEMMGRHSNLSLVDENQVTIDCVHHVKRRHQPRARRDAGQSVYHAPGAGKTQSFRNDAAHAGR